VGASGKTSNQLPRPHSNRAGRIRRDKEDVHRAG
jgi:hypothetical protein